MEQTYTDAAKAAAALAEDDAIEMEVNEILAESVLVDRLIALRMHAVLTLSEMARKMNCSVSKLSRMESGTDRQLKWADVLDYLQALGGSADVSFRLPNHSQQIRMREYAREAGEACTRLAATLEESGCMDEATHIYRFVSEMLFPLVSHPGTNDQLPVRSTSRAAEPGREYKGKKPAL